MSKLNQIQQAIKELDGGSFQKLADSYLYKEGYRSLNPLGSVIGANKVRKGTPDSFQAQDNGLFIFVEHTAQVANVVGKFKQDLTKCLDESKTCVPVTEIERIIFCHTSLLTTEEEGEIYTAAKKAGINISILGIGPISFALCYTYPGLAKDHLGITVDTGQILTPDDFVASYNKNQLATPLDTQFYFREDEVEKTTQSIESNSLVLLSGPAGVGKSRIALEVLRRFEEDHPEFQVFCIFNRGQDIYEDMRAYFSGSGKFLILVDDANRISSFGYVVDLIQNQRDEQEIKVLATVRDYALDKVENAARILGPVENITVAAMSTDQITDLVRSLYGITNSHFLERIVEVAGGSPRLAIMTSKVAVENNSLSSIADVSSLYDEYFSSIMQDLNKFHDAPILKVAGIIAFFRSIDRSNEKLMSSIQEAFGIDTATFWGAADYLHKHELADIYEREVVKISDQVLATYLFYLSVFRNQILDFSIFMEHFYPGQINRLRDAIYPCLNSFDFEIVSEQMRDAVLTKWEHYRQESDVDSIENLIKTFWFILQTEALAYVRDRVRSIEPEPIDIETIEWNTDPASVELDSLLQLLRLFTGTGDNAVYQMALELIYQYAEEKQKNTPAVLRILSEDFGFTRHSHMHGYARQHAVIDSLVKQSMGAKHLYFSRLFFSLAKIYLRTQFRETVGNKRTVTWYKFSLYPASDIFELREKIWTHIFELFEIASLKPYVLDVLHEYCDSRYYLDVKEIVEKDAEQILPLLEAVLCPEKFSDCLLIQGYLKLLRDYKIEYEERIAKDYLSKKYVLYQTLAFGYADIEGECDCQEYERVKRDRIVEYTKNYDYDDYKNLLDSCHEINGQLVNDNERNTFVDGIHTAFCVLAEKDLDLYCRVVDYYLSIGAPFDSFMQPFSLVAKLLKGYGKEKTLNIIKLNAFPTQRQWQFAYQQALSEEDIKYEDLARLYSLYHEADLTEIPYGYDYLLKYQHQDSAVIVYVTQILIDKAVQEPRFSHIFSSLFNPRSETNKQLVRLFSNAPDLLKQAYVAHEKLEGHPDYRGATFNRIMDIDPTFMTEHIEMVYKEKEYPTRYDDSRDYSFVWRRGDHAKVMRAAINTILELEKHKGFMIGTYLERLFCIDDQKKAPLEVINVQDNFVEKLIKDCAKDSDMMNLLFRVIACFAPQRRIKFISLFLENNKSFEDFKHLKLEPSVLSWSDSAVPMIMRRIEYFQAVIGLCSTVELLDHRQYAERLIQSLHARLEEEKKSDFIED